MVSYNEGQDGHRYGNWMASGVEGGDGQLVREWVGREMGSVLFRWVEVGGGGWRWDGQ